MTQIIEKLCLDQDGVSQIFQEIAGHDFKAEGAPQIRTV